MAKTTDLTLLNDVLSESIQGLRIQGSLLIREDYAPPWGAAIPSAQVLHRLLGVNAGVRVAIFHLVEAGQCELHLHNGTRQVLEAGEMAVCFDGAPHRIAYGDPAQDIRMEEILAGGGHVRQKHAPREVGSTSLMCGAFLLQETPLNPLTGALPAVLHCNLTGEHSLAHLTGVAKMMAQEIDRNDLGSGYLVARLLEVLCAEAIRAHVAQTGSDTPGWITAIKDPVVGEAIAAMQANPGLGWSVAQLAASVAMSPSRFAARFAAALGDGPMAYLAKWRMHIACGYLTDTGLTVSQVATQVGYENTPAFQRAFKRLVGTPPARYRKQAGAAGEYHPGPTRVDQ